VEFVVDEVKLERVFLEVPSVSSVNPISSTVPYPSITAPYGLR
jgi:hypothetical protein